MLCCCCASILLCKPLFCNGHLFLALTCVTSDQLRVAAGMCMHVDTCTGVGRTTRQRAAAALAAAKAPPPQQQTRKRRTAGAAADAGCEQKTAEQASASSKQSGPAAGQQLAMSELDKERAQKAADKLASNGAALAAFMARLQELGALPAGLAIAAAGLPSSSSSPA